MINKKLESITIDDLQSLIDNSVRESRTIEYKETLDFSTTKHKKKLLKQVSSFANAGGGDLILGIKTSDEDKGLPVKLTGMEVSSVDEESVRIDNIIRDGLKPRISEPNIHFLEYHSNHYFIFIRIRRSFLSPHRVSLDGHNKFYSRGAAGLYEMSVDQLRVAFNWGERIVERITDFKLNRLSRINEDDYHVQLNDKSKLVIHIIPYNSFNPEHNFDIKELEEQKFNMKCFNEPTIDSHSHYSLNGILKTERSITSLDVISYAEFYRNGIIETVNTRGVNRTHEDSFFFYGTFIEEKIIACIENHLNVLKNLKVVTPIVIFISLLNVIGAVVLQDDIRRPEHASRDRSGFKYDSIQLPEIIIEDFSQDILSLVKLPFDTLWNASGWSCSPNCVNECWEKIGHF